MRHLAPEDYVTHLEESERLHRSVRAFARQPASQSKQRFEALALEIAEFQARRISGAQRLLRLHGAELSSLASIPAVPVDVFRFLPHFAFDVHHAEACFATSGTTGQQPGRHYMRTTKTYEALALAHGRQGLCRHGEAQRLVVALMPYLGARPTSSLNFMAQRFMEAFDGHSLTERRDRNGFRLDESGRWLLDDHGVRLAQLTEVVSLAHRVGEAVLLVATSFALVMLLDALGDSKLPLPAGSVVMPTGGYKGRTREVDPVELTERIKACLGEPAVVAEYGMTELSSQLYEGTLPSGQLRAEPGVFVPPSWLEVIPVEPLSLQPSPAGTPGLATFVDLGNVDSAVRILTRDVVQIVDGGIRLLGRQPRAEPRGCSLSVELLMADAAS